MLIFNNMFSFNSKNKNSKISYSIININDSTKEKNCIQADKDNEHKYRSFCEKAASTSKKWENSGAKLNLEVPKPPKPNNYERLMQFNKQNVLRPAIEQSKATIYLHNNCYELGKDYEAYQAIDLAQSLKIYSKDLKRQKTDRRKSKLEDLLKVNNMNISRTDSGYSNSISGNSMSGNNNGISNRKSISGNSMSGNSMSGNNNGIANRKSISRKSMSNRKNTSSNDNLSNMNDNVSNMNDNVSNMNENNCHKINYNFSDNNFNYPDLDEFESRTNSSSPLNSSSSSDESLSNSMEFKNHNELLNTINEFKILENRNNTNPEDLLPKMEINPIPSAPPAPIRNFNQYIKLNN